MSPVSGVCTTGPGISAGDKSLWSDIQVFPLLYPSCAYSPEQLGVSAKMVSSEIIHNAVISFVTSRLQG